MQLGQLETVHGFNWNSECLSLDRDLAVAVPSVWMWDWFHTCLSDGVFVQELNACMKEFETHGFGMRHLDTYIQLWRWPRGFAHARKVCRQDDSNIRSTVDGSASELWSLVPVLHKYVTDLVQPQNIEVSRPMVVSALLLFESVMLLGKVATGQVPADYLERAISGHLESQQAAWGDSVWLPKSHFALHLGMALRRFGYLGATLTQERMHQVVKRFLAPRRHTPGLERGIMEELTLQHLYELTGLVGTETTALQTPRLASPNQRSAIAMMLQYATIADVMVSGTTFTTTTTLTTTAVTATTLIITTLRYCQGNEQTDHDARRGPLH